ncbi:MAG: oligoendopeptidase F [Ruminococcus sp.]|nr:oligoendopeptidase F [Ruminococcus sp.]
MANRETYSEDLKWNIKDIYSSEEDYEKAFKELEDNLSGFQKYRGHILDNADTLLELLDFDNKFGRDLEQVYIYTYLQNDQDTRNTKYQTMHGKTYRLYEKYLEVTAFITPEILKADYSLIEKYLKDNPKLKVYERTLRESFKNKEHTLSEKEEQLLSSLSTVFNTPDNTYSLLTDADLKFGAILNEEGNKEELTEKSYRKFIESSNRKVRESAFNKLFSTYGNFKNTYASLLASEVSRNNKLANIRKFPSALSASLFQNDIPDAIYDNLIKGVKKNIAPLSKYWKLKKEALGLSSLHIYDSFASITKDSTNKYTEKDAEELILKALNPLGDTYINDLKKAFDDRWIDYPPNTGKRNGAYCTACYNVHPYVLLSFDGSLNNVSTLAHELGHAMHYYYAIKNQTFQDYAYSIFVAEVASQVNQILLSKYLIANTSDLEEKKYLIDDLIQDFKATIYRQTMFADFEKQLHELDAAGSVLTHEVISDTYYSLNKEYLGKNIVIDDLIRYEWERIPHFYMNFYVYQYATAYTASIKIVRDILNKKEGSVRNYLEFLKLGATKTPIESLKVAGVDMSSEDTLNEAFVYFEELVSELTDLYKE